MRLENWSIQHGAYNAPEQGSYFIGEVYGHPTRPDGRRVHTSMIVEVDPETETVRTHSGSIYKLGVADPDYEAVYPNAWERVFEWARTK